MLDRREFLKQSGALAAAAMFAGSASRADASPGDAGDPAWLSATALLLRFRSGQLSPVDVLEAQIKRINTYNEQIDCIT
jgi:amidase